MYGYGTVGWGVVLMGVATALSIVVVVVIWQALWLWIRQEKIPVGSGIASDQGAEGRIERLGCAGIRRRAATDRVPDRMV